MPPVSPASRSGPLVTWLVVFVLLWMTATIFAIYYYVDGNKSEARLTTLTTQYNDVLPSGELQSEDITKLDAKRKSSTPGYNPSMSYFATLLAERNELAQVIGASPDAAVAVANATLATDAAQAKTGGNLPSMPQKLNDAVNILTQTLIARQAEVTSLNAQLKQAQDAATSAAKQMEQNQAELTKTLADVREQEQQANTSSETDRSAKDEQLKKISADADAAQQAAQKQLTEAQASISANTKQLEADKRIIDDLRNKLGLKRANTADAVVRQADGAVVRVPGNGSVYINLGTGDQVSPGLTFEVFDHNEGIPPAGDPATDDNLPKGKGSIEVVRVGAGSSECRILNQQAGQFIHEGDIIANIVYDRNTKYQFFVYGDFDTDQNGVTSPQEGDVIRRLCTQWGGKLTDKISADTDFVILGREPTVLVPSKDDANDPIIQAKAQASLAASDAYQEVKRQALDYHIPILNQNRFLYFVGYFEAAKR